MLKDDKTDQSIGKEIKLSATKKREEKKAAFSSFYTDREEPTSSAVFYSPKIMSFYSCLRTFPINLFLSGSVRTV